MASLAHGQNSEPPRPRRNSKVEKKADSVCRPRATLREEKGGNECDEPPPKQLQGGRGRKGERREGRGRREEGVGGGEKGRREEGGRGRSGEGGRGRRWEEKERGGGGRRRKNYVCSICLTVVHEPHVVSCCGHNFCETCIGRIQRDGKPFPLCNEPGFTAMENKGLKRIHYKFQVRCPHRELGCEWVGVLGKLNQHLNADPQPEHQLEGCPFSLFECIHCKSDVSRQMMEAHTSECPKRPYTCEYCEEYESTFEDVVNHWAECKCYLLPCPNNCNPSGSGIERQNLEHHVKEECPLTVVECDFHYAGCGVKLPCKDMAGHMKEESLAHNSLLAAENQRQAKQLLERDEKMQQLQESVQQLTEQNSELSNRIDQEQRAKQELSQSLQQLMQQNTELSNRIDQQQRAHQELMCTTDQLQRAHQELMCKTDQQQRAHQELVCTTDQLQRAHQELMCETEQQQRANQERVCKTEKQQRANQEHVYKADQLQKAHQQLVCTTERTYQELKREVAEAKDTLQQQRVIQQVLVEKTGLQQKTNQELRRDLTQTKDKQCQQQRAHRELAEKVTCTTDHQQKTNQELRKGLTQTKDKQCQQQRAHRELAEKVTWTTDHQQKTNQELRKGLTQTKDKQCQQQRAHRELAEKVTWTTDQQQKANPDEMEEVARQVKELNHIMQQQQEAHHELASEVALGQQQMERLQIRKMPTWRVQILPINLKMDGFKKFKNSNTTWYSAPFYTHLYEYKMCLNVDANGHRDGRKTHVSVYTCLMRGEFDSHLPWPFQGNVTIQLLNQLEDRKHRTMTIPYSDPMADNDVADRVHAVRERAAGFGKERFVPHSHLNFNRAKKCQYLKDDCLLFRVLFVKLQL